MGYSETVSNYNSVRYTLRQLYIDGFKTRKDYISASEGKESSKNVDNRIRRIVNILNDVCFSSFSKDGKVSYVSIDSRTDTSNPIYKTFETKSFDDTGLILYFLILELLSDNKSYTLSEIERIIFIKNVHNITYWGGQAKNNTVPTNDTLRNWLKKFVSCGIIQKTKTGNKDSYRLIRNNINWTGHSQAISFFSETAPLGILGYFINKDISGNNQTKHIIYKHHFIASAIDSEILEILLSSIRKKHSIEIKLYKYEDKSKQAILCTPIKIYSSTQSSRQYLLAYNNKSDQQQRFQFIRLDRIKTVQIREFDTEYESKSTKARELQPYLWGTQIDSRVTEPQKVSMIIFADLSGDHPETYIVDRLQREGRGGTVEILDEKRCKYEKSVFYPEEMLPWIRTFYGRILSFACDDPSIKQNIYDDMKGMYQTYCGEQL